MERKVTIGGRTALGFNFQRVLDCLTVNIHSPAERRISQISSRRAERQAMSGGA